MDGSSAGSRTPSGRYPVALLPFLFLLFPDGHLLSPRWRPVAWFAARLVRLDRAHHHDLRHGHLDPAVHAGEHAHEAVGSRRSRSRCSSSCCSRSRSRRSSRSRPLAIRFSRSVGDERVQLKWFVTAALLVAVTFTATVLTNSAAAAVLFDVSLLFLYAAIGTAILKHRLYDIDIIINKAVVYGLLAAFITVVYVRVRRRRRRVRRRDPVPLARRYRDRRDRVPARSREGEARREPGGLRQARHTLRGALGFLRARERDVRRREHPPADGAAAGRGDRRDRRHRLAPRRRRDASGRVVAGAGGAASADRVRGRRAPDVPRRRRRRRRSPRERAPRRAHRHEAAERSDRSRGGQAARRPRRAGRVDPGELPADRGPSLVAPAAGRRAGRRAPTVGAQPARRGAATARRAGGEGSVGRRDWSVRTSSGNARRSTASSTTRRTRWRTSATSPAGSTRRSLPTGASRRRSRPRRASRRFP